MANKKEEVKVKNALGIGDLIIPMLSVVILIILTVFVYVPLVNKGLSLKDEIAVTKEKQATITNLNAQLQSLSPSLLQSDSINSRKVIPNSLQVSDYAYYVDQLAQDEGLVFKEIYASDSAVGTLGGEKVSEDSAVFAVSGPLTYEGSYSDILEFLDQLQGYSPFIVSTDNIYMKKSRDPNNNDLWTLELAITGYYIKDPQSLQVNIYSPFSPYTSSASVVNVFSDKARKLNEK